MENTNEELVIITKTELELLEEKSKRKVTPINPITLIANKKAFTDFLKYSQENYQFWLWLWKYRGVEEKVYSYIECIWHLQNGLETIEKEYASHVAQVKAKEAKKAKELEKAKKNAKEALGG